MQSNIFIFHGTGGHPEENWFAWLKNKLEQKGCRVFVPQFPTPEGQSLVSWMNILEPYQNQIDENSVLIGHSLGGLFLLRVLERLPRPVKAAIFVATPIGIKPIKNYEGDNNFSNGFNFNWEKIKLAAKNFVVYHSDNDPYVSLQNGEQLEKNLSVNLNFIPNAGHFNSAAGYDAFKELLQIVLKII